MMLLGLLIVQPYRKVKRKQIMMKLQTVYILDLNSAVSALSGFGDAWRLIWLMNATLCLQWTW
jgi:hypothetical protein